MLLVTPLPQVGANVKGSMPTPPDALEGSESDSESDEQLQQTAARAAAVTPTGVSTATSPGKGLLSQALVLAQSPTLATATQPVPETPKKGGIPKSLRVVRKITEYFCAICGASSKELTACRGVWGIMSSMQG